MFIRIKYFIILLLFSSAAHANVAIDKYKSIKGIIDRILVDKKLQKELGTKDPVLLSEFYCNNNYSFQWYSGLNDNSKRQQLLDIIDADEWMVNKAGYHTIIKNTKSCYTRKDSIINELRLTNLALYIFKDIAYSHRVFVKYNQLHYKPDCLDLPWLLQQSLTSGNFKKYLSECEPETEDYLGLKAQYARLSDSCRNIQFGTTNDLLLKKLKKLNYALQFYRWISCIQYKSCIIINLASKKISYTECGKEIFICNIYPVNIPARDITMTGSTNSIKFYYDVLYPSNLQFDLTNPFQISLCSLDACMDNLKQLPHIEIEDPAKLAEILGIDNETIQNDICLEEATPFTKLNSRHIPLLIVNVPMDFK